MQHSDDNSKCINANDDENNQLIVNHEPQFLLSFIESLYFQNTSQESQQDDLSRNFVPDRTQSGIEIEDGYYYCCVNLEKSHKFLESSLHFHLQESSSPRIGTMITSREYSFQKLFQNYSFGEFPCRLDICHATQNNDKEKLLRTIPEKTRSEYTCFFCLEVMVNPASLHCGHSACFFCMTKLLTSAQGCPICRAKIPTSFTPCINFPLTREILAIFVEDNDHMQRIQEYHGDIFCPNGHLLKESKTSSSRPCTMIGGCNSQLLNENSSDWECQSGCGYRLCTNCYNYSVEMATSKQQTKANDSHLIESDVTSGIKFFPSHKTMRWIHKETDSSSLFSRECFHQFKSSLPTGISECVPESLFFAYSILAVDQTNDECLSTILQSPHKSSNIDHKEDDDQIKLTLILDFINSTLDLATKSFEKRNQLNSSQSQSQSQSQSPSHSLLLESSSSQDLELNSLPQLTCSDLLPSLAQLGYVIYGYGFYLHPFLLSSSSSSQTKLILFQRIFVSSIQNLFKKYLQEKNIFHDFNFVLAPDLIQSIHDMILHFGVTLLDKVANNDACLDSSPLHHVHKEDTSDTLSQSSSPLIFLVSLPTINSPSSQILSHLIQSTSIIQHSICYDKDSFQNTSQRIPFTHNSNEINTHHHVISHHLIRPVLHQLCPQQTHQLIDLDFNNLIELIHESRFFNVLIYDSILSHSLLQEIDKITSLSFHSSKIVLMIQQLYAIDSNGIPLVFTLDAILYLSIAFEYLCLQLIHSSTLSVMSKMHISPTFGELKRELDPTTDTPSQTYLLSSIELMQSLKLSSELSTIFPGIIFTSKISSISNLNLEERSFPVAAREFYNYLSMILKNTINDTLIDPYTGYHITFLDKGDAVPSDRPHSSPHCSFNFIWRPELDLVTEITNPLHRAKIASDLLPKKGKDLLNELKVLGSNNSQLSVQEIQRCLHRDYNLSLLDFNSFCSHLSLLIHQRFPHERVVCSIEMMTCFYHITEIYYSRMRSSLKTSEPTITTTAGTVTTAIATDKDTGAEKKLEIPVPFISIYDNQINLRTRMTSFWRRSSCGPVALRPLVSCSNYHPLLPPTSQQRWWRCSSVPEPHNMNCQNKSSIFYPPTQQVAVTCLEGCEYYCLSCYQSKLLNTKTWMRIPLDTQLSSQDKKKERDGDDNNNHNNNEDTDEDKDRKVTKQRDSSLNDEINIAQREDGSTDRICCENLNLLSLSLSVASSLNRDCSYCTKRIDKFMMKSLPSYRCSGLCDCCCCGECYQNVKQNLQEIKSGFFPVITHSLTLPSPAPVLPSSSSSVCNSSSTPSTKSVSSEQSLLSAQSSRTNTTLPPSTILNSDGVPTLVKFDSKHSKKIRHYCGRTVGQEGYLRPCEHCSGVCGPDFGCQCLSCAALDGQLSSSSSLSARRPVVTALNFENPDLTTSLTPPSSGDVLCPLGHSLQLYEFDLSYDSCARSKEPMGCQRTDRIRDFYSCRQCRFGYCDICYAIKLSEEQRIGNYLPRWKGGQRKGGG